MAPQKASRSPTSKPATKPTSKRLLTTKASRKPRWSLPSSASESQKTLTQIHFVPRFGQPEVLDLEDLEPIGLGTEGEEAVRATEAPRSTALPRPTPGSKSTKKRKRKLEKDPGDKTLTQIGYVARYLVKDIEDEQDMEYLQPDDPDATIGEESTKGEGQPLRSSSPAEPVRVPRSMIETAGSGEDRHTMGEETEPDPIGLGTKSTFSSNRNQGGGHPQNQGTHHDQEDSKRETVASKRSRMRKEIANHLTSPEKSTTRGSGKRKAQYQDTSGDAESDYADDESPKRSKRQRISPDSHASIASRLRPRRTRVSYVVNKVTKDVNSSENQSNPKRIRKSTRIVCVSKPKTPVKKRVLEIPSSQSPAITPLSIRSRPPTRSGEMSPLRSPLTDLSAHSRMANSAKIRRAAERATAKQNSSEPQPLWFRNIQQTATIASPANVTNENILADQESQQSLSSSQSSLPDLATIFGRTQQVTKPRESQILQNDAVSEQNEDNDDELDIGLETQGAFDHIDTSSSLSHEDGYSCEILATEEPPLELIHSMTPERTEESNTRLESVSPPWITNNKNEAQKSTRHSSEVRQSQISTQGVPSSSIPFPTQREQADPSQIDDKPKDLNQIWDSTDSSAQHESLVPIPDAATKLTTSSPHPTLIPKSRDLTQIWDSAASEPSQPKDVVEPPQSTFYQHHLTTSPASESRTKTRDLTQIWDSDSSGREVLTASQLLPASLMESLPRPPAWTQVDMQTQGVESDDDWI